MSTSNESYDNIRRNASAVSPSAKLSASQDSSRARSRSQVGRSHSRQVVDPALSLGGHDHELTSNDKHIQVDNTDDDVAASISYTIEEPDAERQQFPPPQYPTSEASGETRTSLVSYRTAPPPFSSLFGDPSSSTDQPHGPSNSHGPSGSEISQDNALYDTQETGDHREQPLPAPAYEPPAESSSASSTAYQDSLANETKRALPRDTKGASSSKSKDDDAEPPPAYSEGYSPLEAFSYIMAAAGGASSIITQVQQGGPPINTLAGETPAPRLQQDEGERLC